MNDQLFFEQEGSLVERLESAGIEHGDSAELTLEGVGVRAGPFGEPSLAFCPSRVLHAKVVRRGTAQERAQKIPAAVSVSNKLLRRILDEAPTHGFVQLRLRIHSNGMIQLNGHVMKSEPVSEAFHVHGTESYRERKDRQLVAH